MDFYVNEDTAWLRKAVRWTVNVVLVLASAWFLVYGFCTQVPVSGGSMQPVLDADDVVLVNRLCIAIGMCRFALPTARFKNALTILAKSSPLVSTWFISGWCLR